LSYSDIDVVPNPTRPLKNISWERRRKFVNLLLVFSFWFYLRYNILLLFSLVPLETTTLSNGCSHCLQIAFTSLVYPALVLAYMGQAAYISTHYTVGANAQIGFYVSVPGRHLDLFSRNFLEYEKYATPWLIWHHATTSQRK
jgi:uncharacterized membrane protein (DUF485 family)